MMSEIIFPFIIDQFGKFIAKIILNFYVVLILIIFLISRYLLTTLNSNNVGRSKIFSKVIFFIKFIIVMFLSTFQLTLYHYLIIGMFWNIDRFVVLCLTFIFSIVLCVLDIKTNNSHIFRIFKNNEEANTMNVVVFIMYFTFIHILFLQFLLIQDIKTRFQYIFSLSQF